MRETRWNNKAFEFYQNAGAAVAFYINIWLLFL